MPGEILDLSRDATSATVDADYCVIGSGPGGATAAMLLAEAGEDVLILEEGGDKTGAQLSGRDGQSYDQLYMDRGGRMTEDLSITVLQGRALGGGGVINACDVVPIAGGVLAHWRDKHGLSELTEAAIRPHAQAALKDLHANPIAEQQLNLANRLLRDGATKLNLRQEVMRHNRVGCVGAGQCLIGCPVNAKKNPRFVAVPKAIAAGARVFCRARAVRIEHAGAETKHIHVRTLDSKGYREESKLVVRAKVVIVAANAIGSAQLLLQSGIGNAHVGRHVSLQPQLPVMARFKQPIRAFEGIPQAVAITHHEVDDHPEHGLWGFRIEPIMGTPGIVASLVPVAGLAAKRQMATFARTAAALVLVPDSPSGRVLVGRESTRAGTRPIVRYDHLAEHKQRIREGAKVTARIYLAAGAEQVAIPSNRPITIRSEKELARIDELSLEPATVPMISAHQQGGVRMASSEKDGAANPAGMVWGTRDVYVFDSGLFPSSSSTHTMTPIITMARLLTTRLLAEKKA